MYLDPGFGGMLIQIIIALIAAGGAIAFTLRKKIRYLFLKGNGSKDNVKQTVQTGNTSDDEAIDMLSNDKI